MTPRTCHCVSDSERYTCSLRAQITFGHVCPSVSREPYVEREPYVDLYVTLTSGAVTLYQHVRGIGVEYVKHASPSKEKERTLTFEGEGGITNVFDVVSWTTEATDQ